MPKTATLSKDLLGGLDLFAPDDVALDETLVFIEDSRWKECCKNFQKSNEFAIDFETYSKEPLKDNKKYQGALDPYKGGEIRLMSIAIPSSDLVMMVDLGANQERVGLYETFFQFILFPKLRDIKVIKRAHNAVFEMQWLLHKFGVKCLSFRDSMIASQLLYAGQGAAYQALLKSKGYLDSEGKVIKPHSLKAVALRFNYQVDKSEQRSQWGLPLLTNSQLNYSGKDATLALEIGRKLDQLIEEEDLGFSYQCECLALPYFAYIRYYGVSTDLELAHQIYAAYVEESQKLLSVFKEKFPNVNPKSPIQVKKCLLTNFEDITELESTDADALFPYRHHPEIYSLMRYKSILKPIEWLDNLFNRISDDSRIRAGFTQNAHQGTGRASCTEPNMQNISGLNPTWKKAGLKAIRECFKARPGRKFVIADLKAAHAQIALFLAGVDVGQKDLHLITAQGIFSYQGKEYTYEELAKIRKDKDHPENSEVERIRTLSKTVFYGKLNRSSPRTLQKSFAVKPPYLDVPLEDCEMLLNAWDIKYKDLLDLQTQRVRFANAYNIPLDVGFFTKKWGLSVAITGRKLYLEKKPKEYDGKTSIKVDGNNAVAHTWLAVEADLLKRAAGLFMIWLSENPEIDCHPISWVHDELDLDCSEEHALICATKLKELMDSCMQLVIPTYYNDDPVEKMIVDCFAEK